MPTPHLVFWKMIMHRQVIVLSAKKCSRNRHWHPTATQFCSHQHSVQLSTSSAQQPKSSSNTVYERGANLVKNTDIKNQYLEQVRAEVVDPALHLKTIEDELCGAIGKALGRQGEKVLFAIREMTKEHTQYLEHISSSNQSYEEALQSAHRHNEARKKAIKARWELLVHRQAVGFTVDNHKVVHTTFPIGEPLPTRVEDIIESVGSAARKHETDMINAKSTSSSSSCEQPAKKVWGDQLDWWQRVGRWR